MAGTEFTPGGAHFRGKLGSLQYRRIRGKEIVSPVPDMSEVEWSQAQEAQRDKFKVNGRWGKNALADPVVKAAYDARARELDIPVYALIYKDRRSVPHVEAVDLSGYTGKAGQEIRIQVDDAFEGFQVELSIRDAAGTVLEAGSAIRSAPDQIQWTYRTTIDLASSSGILVEAVAKDRPGNCDSRIQMVPVPKA
jgi:hypothetical protein